MVRRRERGFHRPGGVISHITRRDLEWGATVLRAHRAWFGSALVGATASPRRLGVCAPERFNLERQTLKPTKGPVERRLVRGVDRELRVLAVRPWTQVGERILQLGTESAPDGDPVAGSHAWAPHLGLKARVGLVCRSSAPPIVWRVDS